MLGSLLDLNPPHLTSPWWWSLVGGLGLLSVALLIIVWWIRPKKVAAKATDALTLEQLRSQALADVARTRASAQAGEFSARLAAQQLSRLVRAFIGTVSQGDADFATASQLRVAAKTDSRLLPTADFTQEIETACFAPDGDPDLDALSITAEEVIAAWR